MKINIVGTWLICPPLYTECDSLFFHRPDCLHNTHFPVYPVAAACGANAVSEQLLARSSLVSTVNPARCRSPLMRRHRLPTWHWARVTAHAHRARIMLHFRRASARSPSRPRDDGYCPGIRRLIDRTRFKCYRSLMPIWPVHLNAASKSRIIAWNCRCRRRIGRSAAVFIKDSAQSTGTKKGFRDGSAEGRSDAANRKLSGAAFD